jgi:ribose transport system substrate-binding protein
MGFPASGARRISRRPVEVLLAGVAAGSLLLSACSSSDSPSGSGGSASAQADAGSSAAGGSCAARASALVKQQANVNVAAYPTASFDASSLKGKTIWFISPSQAIPEVVTETQAFTQAADLLGIKTHIWDGQASPALFNQGIQLAVSQKASGILILAIAPSLVTNSLKQAEAAGIPVVDAFNGSPSAPLVDGVKAHLTPSFVQLGAQMADFVMSQTNCNAHAVLYYASIYTSQVLLDQGAAAEFKRLCPSCSFAAVNVDPNTVATQLSGTTQTYLQTHPNTNYLMSAYDALPEYMIAGEKQLGKSVPLVSQGTANLSIVRSGGLVKAEVTYPPYEIIAWFYLDQIMRVMAGTSPSTTKMSLVTLDHGNVGANDNNNTLFPGFANYQAKFKSLWGIG